MAGVDDVLQQLQALSAEDRKSIVTRLNLADRIVVETSSRPPPRKLRLFSGKSPVPSGEVDFDTWRLLVKQLEEDGNVTDVDKKAIILQNLLRPALDAVRSVEGSFREVLKVLDNLYGTIVDGAELLIKFHTTYQNEKETASAYLQRIYLLLMETAEKGGVTLADVPKFLLKQFIRGSVDEALIAKLKLEDKLDNPPSFADFLLSVRTEEGKLIAKKLRLKASGQVSDSSQVSTLQAKVSQLEAQVQSMSCQKPSKGPSSGSRPSGGSSSGSSAASKDSGRQAKGRKPGFRFRFCYR